MTVSENVVPGGPGHSKHHNDLAKQGNELEQIVKEGRLSEDQLSHTIVSVVDTGRLAPSALARVVRAARAVVGLRTGTNSVNNGKPVAGFSRKRRNLIIRNLSSFPLLVGVATGTTVNAPAAYDITIPAGQEYVSGFDPRPHWIKSRVIGTGTIATGSATITAVNNIASWTVGMPIASQVGGSAGLIPAGVTVQSIDVGASTLTLSAAATGSGSNVPIAAVASAQIETITEG